MEDYVRHLSEEGSSGMFVLYPKEWEVLQLLAEGWSTKEVATLLHIKMNTIDTQ
jgi:DNA-binding NarL/FixJ family response regulator